MDQPTNSVAQGDRFPLNSRQQWCNVVIYALTNGLVYLAAPVLYVGIVQTSLCNALGYSDTLANLPTSAFYCVSIVPMLVAWRFHTVGAIKPVIVTCYVISGVGGAIMAALLYWPTPNWLLLSAVILHSGLIGGAGLVSNVFLWELIRRSVAPERRGLAFSLTFGVGPILAILGSLGAQTMLTGTLEYPWVSNSGGMEMRSLAIEARPFPTNFAVLYALTTPILVAAALLAAGYILPPVQHEPARPPLVAGLTENVRGVLTDRVLVLAVVAYMLIECGFTIQNNMTLYTQEALNQPAEAYAGYQNAIRFTFKVFAGLFLGWLLSRTHAKMGMVATCGLALCGILWVLLMPHQWFLISFGLMGAGELYGVYYPNYLMNRSRPDRVRHNLALLPLLGLATSVAPAMFGAISDGFGLPVSFIVAALVIAASLVVIVLGLPARPLPPK